MNLQLKSCAKSVPLKHERKQQTFWISLKRLWFSMKPVSSGDSGETRLCSLGTLHFFQLCVCACVCVCVCARACMCAHVCVSSGCFQVKIAAGRAEGDLSLWSHRLRWWQRSGRSVAGSTAVFQTSLVAKLPPPEVHKPTQPPLLPYRTQTQTHRRRLRHHHHHHDHHHHPLPPTHIYIPFSHPPGAGRNFS